MKVHFLSTSKMVAQDVLTQIKRWQSYDAPYIEKKVNENLGSHLRLSLGASAARLSEALQLGVEEIKVQGSFLGFPGGQYEQSYSARDKKSGHLHHRVSFNVDLLASPIKIQLILEALSVFPEDIELPMLMEPLSLIPILRKRKWRIDCQLEDLVEARHEQGTYSLSLQPGFMRISGISVEHFFVLWQSQELSFGT